MSLPAEVSQRIAEHFGATARVEHRHNHTGAGKLSFVVHAPEGNLWVKVAADDDEDRALTRWARWADRLTELHCAPPVLEVAEFGGRTGLVFPFLDAPKATPQDVSGRAADVLRVLAKLHQDSELADQLGPARPARHSFDEVWIRRFDADLAIVDGHLSGELHRWLVAEVDRIRDQLRVDAFDRPVHAALHADPWHENILLEPDRLWLLDWEDLSVGDPVVDDSIALFDSYGAELDLWWAARPPADDHEALRFTLAQRMLRLDQVIDGAADWVENDNPAIRQQKYSAYRAALARYGDAPP
jgi:fructosamine-3-kinase